MKLSSRWCLLSSVLALAGTSFAADTGLPQTQPAFLTIIRESVKAGRAADHARHEAGWPAAFEKAKSPDYYLALTSITGPSEAWYLSPSASHAAQAESMKREDKDPVLSAELSRLAARDAEFIDSVRVVQTMARPELSFGTYPNLAKARFFQITHFTVRPGHTAKFEAIIKTYNAVRKRSFPDTSYRYYSVIAGMAGPTYVLFLTVEDFGQFDQTMSTHMKTLAAANAEEKAQFDTWGESVVREETQRFRLDPTQSYVSPETRATDPSFWSAK